MSRARRAVVLALLVPLGLATKLAGDGWIRNHLGGVFYVAFWILAVLFVWPHARRGRVAAAVLLVTCGIELLQLWHPPVLERIRATFVGRTLLGATFSPIDFAAYALGATLALCVEYGARAKTQE